MKIQWTEKASADALAIHAFIAERSEIYAEIVYARILARPDPQLVEYALGVNRNRLESAPPRMDLGCLLPHRVRAKLHRLGWADRPRAAQHRKARIAADPYYHHIPAK